MTIPRKTRAAIKEHKGKYHKIAAELDVNVFYVYQLIQHGQEPRNKEVRRKMGYLKNPKPYTPPEHVIWWRSLTKPTRSNHVRDLWIQQNQKTRSKP